MFNPGDSPGLRQLLTEDPATSVGPSSLWDQFAANILLTVQAFQELHKSLDGKFTRGSDPFG